jgi:hypothetical protein
MATVAVLAIGRKWASGVIYMLNIVNSLVTKGPEVESRTGGDMATTVDSEAGFAQRQPIHDELERTRLQHGRA